MDFGFDEAKKIRRGRIEKRGRFDDILNIQFQYDMKYIELNLFEPLLHVVVEHTV